MQMPRPNCRSCGALLGVPKESLGLQPAPEVKEKGQSLPQPQKSEVSPEPEIKETQALCPYCKEEIQEGAVKCEHCGSPLADEPLVVYCPKCGTQNTDAANFCSKCGNSLRAKCSSIIVAPEAAPITQLSAPEVQRLQAGVSRPGSTSSANTVPGVGRRGDREVSVGIVAVVLAVMVVLSVVVLTTRKENNSLFSEGISFFGGPDEETVRTAAFRFAASALGIPDQENTLSTLADVDFRIKNHYTRKIFDETVHVFEVEFTERGEHQDRGCAIHITGLEIQVGLVKRGNSWYSPSVFSQVISLQGAPDPSAERRAKISRAAADTKTIVTQTQMFYSDQKKYPHGLVTGNATTGLLDAGYMNSYVDPFSTAASPADMFQYTLNGAAFAGQENANMTDDIRAWSVGPDNVSGTADDVGYSNQSGAFGS